MQRGQPIQPRWPLAAAGMPQFRPPDMAPALQYDAAPQLAERTPVISAQQQAPPDVPPAANGRCWKWTSGSRRAADGSAARPAGRRSHAASPPGSRRRSRPRPAAHCRARDRQRCAVGRGRPAPPHPAARRRAPGHGPRAAAVAGSSVRWAHQEHRTRCGRSRRGPPRSRCDPPRPAAAPPAAARHPPRATTRAR